MNDERFCKTASRIGNITILIAFLLSPGCLTTKRNIPRALFYDNDYVEYCKLDAKKPPQNSVAEHHQKLAQNTNLKDTVKSMQNNVHVLESQILPDLKADLAYLEGRATNEREIRNAYLDSIAKSMQEIRDFNKKGLDTLNRRIEASYIPLGVPPFVRKNIWKPEDDLKGSFTLIIDKTNQVTHGFSPMKGELCSSATGKFRFVLVRPQDDGGLRVIPISRKYEITDDDLKEGGTYYKEIDINVRRGNDFKEGDYAGIIVENKLGLFYDTSATLDSFNTGEVLLFPMKDILESPEIISVVDTRHQKEAAFSFTLFGLYEDEQ